MRIRIPRQLCKFRLKYHEVYYLILILAILWVSFYNRDYLFLNSSTIFYGGFYSNTTYLNTFKQKVSKSKFPLYITAANPGVKVPNNQNTVNFEKPDYYCGELCDTSDLKSGKATPFHPFIHKHFDCDRIMLKLNPNPNLNGGRDRYYSISPKFPPDHMYSSFTMGGHMPLSQYSYRTYYTANYRTTGNRTNILTLGSLRDSLVDRILERLDSGYTYGPNPVDILGIAISNHWYAVLNRSGLILTTPQFSSDPWQSALLITYGARRTLVWDIMDNDGTGAHVSYHDPKISFINSSQLYRAYLTNKGKRYQGLDSKGRNTKIFVKVQHPNEFMNLRVDFVVAHSVIHQLGLGAWGEGLDPFADLEIMGQLWCYLAPGAILFLSVPFHAAGSILQWNAGRVYGPDRLAHLTANWEVLDFLDACTLTRGHFCEMGIKYWTVVWVLRRV